MVKRTFLCVALVANIALWATAKVQSTAQPNLLSQQTDTTTNMNKKSNKSVFGKEHNIKEVVVTGVHQQASINSVSDRIGENLIDRSMGKSLASILEHVSGVSSIQTGTTVAKPVINGMSLTMGRGRLDSNGEPTMHPKLTKTAAVLSRLSKGQSL